MPIDDVLMDLEMHMEKAVEHLHHELRGLRTGRASPALVEDIRVDYYGTQSPLKSIASISVPESTQLLIKPFSPQDMKTIEKAINDSKLGLTAHSDGRQLRLQLPAMSQERRLQMVGQTKQHSETAKIAIRNARRDANKILDTEKKGSVITEDEDRSGKESVQELTKQFEAKVDELIEKKRNEIMQV